jgi:hypothetical protein
MSDKLFRLAEFWYQKKEKHRSHFYRHRHLLDLRCDEFNACHWLRSEVDMDFARQLALYGPLAFEDVNEGQQKLLKQWKEFPKDSKFYSMCLRQIWLWKSFGRKSVGDFLESQEGKSWFDSRRKLNRVAYFELDREFKRTKQNFLQYEETIRKVIRSNPLITYMDLKRLGAKNLQTIWERFPQREVHRMNFLRQLASLFDSALKNQKLSKVDRSQIPTESVLVEAVLPKNAKNKSMQASIATSAYSASSKE